MPRTLPWLSNSNSSPPRSATSRPTKRARTGSDGAQLPPLRRSRTQLNLSRTGLPSPSPASDPVSASDRGTEPVAPPAAGSRAAQARTPSTSPPAHGPPDVEYMREGLDADDIWVMVEDEFYDMAKSFTAHLHEAEYERQRQLARDRNLGAGGSIARPVDGKTVLAKDKLREKDRRKQEKERKGKVGRALGGASSSSDGESSDSEEKSDHDLTPRRVAPRRLKRNSTLQDLMFGPSKAHKSLVGIQGPVLKTRAAAGYTQAQNTPSTSRTVDRLAELARKRSKHAAEGEDSTTASEDEDDLDATPTRWSYLAPRGVTPSSTVQSKSSTSILKDTSKPKSAVRDSAKLLRRTASVTFEELDLPKAKSSLPDNEDLESAFGGFLRPTPLPNPRNRTSAKSRDIQADPKKHMD